MHILLLTSSQLASTNFSEHCRTYILDHQSFVVVIRTSEIGSWNSKKLSGTEVWAHLAAIGWNGFTCCQEDHILQFSDIVVF